MLARKITGEAGEHVVLGFAEYGVERTAAALGGRHLMNETNWRPAFLAVFNKPGTKFTVSLDGMAGSSVQAKVMEAMQRGASGRSATGWELLQFRQAGRLGEINFVETVSGRLVSRPNPF